MINRRHLVGLSAAAMLASTPGRQAQAQVWPNRFVKLVVPFTQGGPTDFVARLVAERLSKGLSVQVVIENRGGAGTNIGAELVARAAPDGYTVLVGTGALAINRNLYKSLTYDAAADLAPVSLMVSLPFFMFVPNLLPVHSVADFIAYAKANRGKLKFGSPGTGTPPHLAGELLKQLAGIELTHVPYRGASDALNDLIPGRIDLFFASGATLEQSRAGQIRALAVSGAKRDAAAPELPTIAEAGVPGFDVSSWYALFVPAKTPSPIVAKLQAETVAALADPAVKGRLEQLGYTIVGSSADALGAQLKAEIVKWGPIIKAAGIGLAE